MGRENMKREAVKWLNVSGIEISLLKIDAWFLRMAYELAYNHSPDPSTKNGAIIIQANDDESQPTDCKIITYGVNQMPCGIIATEERFVDKTTKYKMIVHAEHAAILHAARDGFSIAGATMYCPFCSCHECAKAIIHSGIKKLVGHLQLMVKAEEHTTWKQSLIDGWKMFEEAGVRCVLYDGNIGVVARFAGQDILI